jgi:hypothetical protein
LLDNPVRLEAGKTYTIEANYNSICFYYYGYDGIHSITADDVVISFTDNENVKFSPSSISG